MAFFFEKSWIIRITQQIMKIAIHQFIGRGDTILRHDKNSHAQYIDNQKGNKAKNILLHDINEKL